MASFILKYLKVLLLLNVSCRIVQASWSKWSGFSSCSVTCGRGYSYRYRRCIDSDCEGVRRQRTTCDIGECNMDYDHFFYVSYFEQKTWSRWANWSPCSTTCGPGSQNRRRWCLDYEGKVVEWRRCDGRPIERRKCGQDVPCLQATAVSSDKNVTLARPSANETAANESSYGIEKENTNSTTTATATTTTTISTTTPTPTTPAKIDGGWGGWSDWSGCDVPCGGGERRRRRSCDQPAPSGGGDTCDGEDEEEDECQMGDCYSWSVWGEFGACDVECGNGTKTKWRTCEANFDEVILKNITEVDHGCTGSTNITSDCVMTPCRNCSEEKGGCEQVCVHDEKLKKDVCRCNPGFKLHSDNSTCQDINECEMLNHCDGLCINGFGSYFCFCDGVNFYWDLQKQHCFENKRKRHYRKKDEK